MESIFTKCTNSVVNCLAKSGLAITFLKQNKKKKSSYRHQLHLKDAYFKINFETNANRYSRLHVK